MKKRSFVLYFAAILLMGALMGCGSTNPDSKTPDVTAEVKPVSVTVWHDGNEAIMQTIQDYTNDKLKEDKITVLFEKKSGLTDQLKLYGNDDKNGPDLYFYAHDSLGMFAEMGILSPVTDLLDSSAMEELLPMTVDACTYKDIQYMLPVYFETLLFMYNKDLWEGDVPAATDDLYHYMAAHTDTEAGTYAVVNQHSTAYNVSPFINGFGGYIIDKNAKPGLNEQATIDAITYNKKFADLQADGDYNTVTTLFNEGKAAAIIGGPWLVSGISDAGINLGIKPLSGFILPNGKALAPYSGVQGIGVLKHAAINKKDALVKVLAAILDKDLGTALAKTANCAPANSQTYEDVEVSANEMVSAMKDTAAAAVPMPNIPEMSVMWGPAESLLAAVNKSGEDVKTAADTYQKNALTAIKDMQ